MALPSSLHRFRITLSDIDRGVYNDLDLRLAMHPSESAPFLFTRLIAFALNDTEGLEFAPGGLSDSEVPCISQPGAHGGTKLWIEIGNPSARKLHKASKASEQLKVYTYKNPDALVAEIKANKVHEAERIEIYSLNSKFIDQLVPTLARDNRWDLVHTEGSLTITIGDKVVQGELTRHTLS